MNDYRKKREKEKMLILTFTAFLIALSQEVSP